MAASKILTFLKDKRDVNIHVEPVPFRADIAVHASEQMRLTESLTTEIFEGGRLVGRHESPPGQPELESADEPATISTVYTFSDWVGGEDVFQLSGQYLNALKAIAADGMKRGSLT
jgi:hypothetical protein